MSDIFSLKNIRNYLTIKKISGQTHIYVIFTSSSNNSDNKVFLPCYGMIPLNNAITDSATRSKNHFVFFGVGYDFLKKIDFVLSVNTTSNEQAKFVPIPNDLILKSLTEEEKDFLEKKKLSYKSDGYFLFQGATFNEE